MTAMDEILWAEGHRNRLENEGSLEGSKEHILGFMDHTLRALRELAVAAGVAQEVDRDA